MSDATEIQNWIMIVNIILSTCIAFWLNYKSKKDTLESSLYSELLEIQRYSLYDTFLEDKNYTKQWDTLKERYEKNELNGDETNKFLRYDAYTEIIFNFICKSMEFYKSEKKLLEFVDFESWIDIHAACWKNPLQAHSNRKVYGDKMFDMVNRWLQ